MKTSQYVNGKKKDTYYYKYNKNRIILYVS
jgi:hypothetical protein